MWLILLFARRSGASRRLGARLRGLQGEGAAAADREAARATPAASPATRPAPPSGCSRSAAGPHGLYRRGVAEELRGGQPVRRCPACRSKSRLLTMPLAHEAGGTEFHPGGKHWESQDDPEWKTIADWVERPSKAVARCAVPLLPARPLHRVRRAEGGLQLPLQRVRRRRDQRVPARDRRPAAIRRAAVSIFSW